MGSKIKDITSRLEDICKQRIDLGLEKVAGRTLSSTATYQRPQSTSVPTELAVYGRDHDKAKIIEMVLRDNEPNDANFGVISIVGMGGVGKTTLAREVYNDKAVENFYPRGWVCVSDDFDTLRISKAILESINSKQCDLQNLDQVQIQLKEALTNKKFLFVLDDVWNKNYNLWETLRSPFLGGALGSKIIVTTRTAEVALLMGPLEYHNLQVLSDDDCWSVFVKHAFQSRNVEAHHSLELIHEKVVEKCKGLPLAAKTLGSLLRSKQRNDGWDDIWKSKIWDLSDESEILPVLKLSYYHLPSHLKRCFAYCAILPKDHEFEEKELVLLWMAEGLIQQEKDKRPLDEIGGEYFNSLLSRSLFQQSSSNKSKFGMHDLINDLARWVSGETSFRLEDEHAGPMQSERFKRARYISYTSGYCEGHKKFEVLHGFERLRTFLPVLECEAGLQAFISNTVVSDLLPKFKKLRALSLQNYYITELPDSIGGLLHLRYLNLSNTVIRSLPESVCSLFNLQSLILRNCSRLMKLPSNMQNMVNLQHLDITGAYSISEMPIGIKELKSLRTLSAFTLGKVTGCGLKDLKNFKFLHGEFSISGMKDVVDAQDTMEAILRDKKDLNFIHLNWGPQFDDSPCKVMEENVLEMLQPHRNIRRLTIECYGGTRFPSWLADASNMVVLSLERCENCKSLPPLGLLGSLKELFITGFRRLESIGCEILGEGCSRHFPSLETLCFEDMEEWKYWDTNKRHEHVEIFPRLSKLSIRKCPKLSGKLPEDLPSLETLEIYGCAQLVVELSSLPLLHQLDIRKCDGIEWRSPTNSRSLNSVSLSGISKFGNSLVQGFQGVECLNVYDCEELIRMWQNEIRPEKPPKELHILTSLRKLDIYKCPNLVFFAEVCFLPLLTELRISNCDALTSLPERMIKNTARLEILRIEKCSSITFIFKNQLPSSLKVLSVQVCQKLQYLLDDREESNESSSKIPILKSMDVFGCPSLTCLSARGQLPATLQLIVWFCSELSTLSKGQLPASLRQLKISNCPKLESIAERFDHNASLEDIDIGSCENLKSIPKGLCHLSHLHKIWVTDCPSLVSFSEERFPNTNLISFRIRKCQKLKALPNCMHSLKSIQDLEISECPSIISFLEESFPINITSLSIGGHQIYKPLVQWGLRKLTSLRKLEIESCPDVVSFPQEEIGMKLPTSLVELVIGDFPKLKYLSSDGFKNLTSLEDLSICDCPNLISFPEAGLPSSLLKLRIHSCPTLKNHCKRNKGEEWLKIAQIPFVWIDNKFIYDPEDKE